jgi:hypothetical protein
MSFDELIYEASVSYFYGLIFSRVAADIDCNGICGRYELEIAEMFLKAFDDSYVDVLGGLK